MAVPKTAVLPLHHKSFVASEESNLILVSSNDLANQLVKTDTDSSALRTIPSFEPIQSAGSTRI